MIDNDMDIKFRTKVDKHPNGWWSFGVCLSHQDKETYVYINFFKWSISIGFMYDDFDYEYWHDKYEDCEYKNE